MLLARPRIAYGSQLLQELGEATQYNFARAGGFVHVLTQFGCYNAALTVSLAMQATTNNSNGTDKRSVKRRGRR